MKRGILLNILFAIILIACISALIPCAMFFYRDYMHGQERHRLLDNSPIDNLFDGWKKEQDSLLRAGYTKEEIMHMTAVWVDDSIPNK